MSDPVLTIVQNGCNELGITPPSLLIGASDPQELQYLAVANAAAEEVRDDPDNGWCVLERLNLFNSVQGQAEYDLPLDYGRLIIDTVWDRSQLTPMQGPLSPALWQTIKSGLIGNGIYFTRYRVVRSATSPKKVFVVDPSSPNTGSPLVFEYQSTHSFAAADLSSTSASIQDDTNVFLMGDKLLKLAFKWMWRRENGLEYSTYLEQYNQALDLEVARDRPQPGFSLEGNRYRQNFLGYMNIPDTGYGS